MSGALTRMLGTTAFTVLATVLAAPAAYAQATPNSPATPTAGSGGAQLEEVVVTAQRRTENLQNVPVSVVAVGGEQLRRAGIQTVEALNRLAPNAVIERVGLFPGAASLSIRGVGYSGIESFTDPDVAVYVNGIYQARNATALSQTVDVSSIEVLRGPQGTLYGRNAYAGAISVQTNRPNMTNFEGSAVASIGSQGLRDFDFVGNVPLVNNVLAGRIAVRSHDLGGLWHNNGIIRGVVDQTIAGKRIGAEHSLVVRPTLRYTPNERWDVQFIGEFLREKDDAAPIASVPIIPNKNSPSGFTPSPVVAFGGYEHNPFGDPVAGIAPDGTSAYETGYSFGSGQPMKFNQNSFTLDASYDTGFGRIRFLGNHQTTNSEVWVDTDGSVANIFSSTRWENYKGDSGEIQFVSKFNAPIDVVAGVFGFHDEYKTTQYSYTNNNANFPEVFNVANYLRLAPGATAATCNASLPLAARTGCVYPFYVISYVNNGGKRTAYAAYVQGEYHFTDQLSVVAGIRYAYERKYGYYGSNSELGATGLGLNLDPTSHAIPTQGLVFHAAPFKNDGWAPRVGVNYKLSPDIFLFAFWQRAFKSGGFNANAADRTAFQTPYGPEKVDNFEGGVKSEWFDHKLRVNVQGFYAKYKDLQRSQVVASPTSPSGVTTVVTNNADLTSYGVEAEIAARPMEGLTVFSNIGWDKAKYDRYCFDFNGAEATPTPIDTTHGICGPVVPVQLANGTTQYLVPQDFSGNRPLRAPRWDVTGGFTKEVQLEPGKLALTATVNYRSDVATDLANRVFSNRRSMTTMDANLVWTPTGGRYSVSLWGRNLTNNVQILGYTPVGATFAFASPTPPRMYGITATLNF